MQRRLTQRDIAQLAGVSQATVSFVLNESRATAARIPDETRQRVLKVIRETGYVADPIARRMAKGLNRILGVFTYEPAFPSEQADFFAPFLLGIEEEAQRLGYDLLLLTGAGSGKKRKIFDSQTRMRIADGCIILGKEFNRSELKRLVRGDYPFVAVGRRDDAGGPVPYVGGDYVTGTCALVQRVRALGHERLAYVGPTGPGESPEDRWRGFRNALTVGGGHFVHIPSSDTSPADILDMVMLNRLTAVFFVELADAVKFEQAARARNLSLPEDISVIVLGSHVRAERSETRFTSFHIPREEMARQATRMLVRIIEYSEPGGQILLPCHPFMGETLGPVKSQRKIP